MPIQPLILGTGRAGQALAKCLASLKVMNPDWDLELPVWLERGASLAQERQKYARPLLCVMNPHGLHADAILEADRAGFSAILSEKPACVSLEQLHALKSVRTPTAILHVYRQTWGLQTLKQMMLEHAFGTIIAIEGRYWQASAAERGLSTVPPAKGWKDDTRLAGAYDVYLDIATHWVDAVSFLYGEAPSAIQGWRSFVNAPSSHRDSHVQLSIDYPQGGRAFGSISKAVHGATNLFEIHVLGEKRAATWKFQEPDEILIGEGLDRRVLTRRDSKFGSQNPPHHGMGWVEGYMEIAASLIRELHEGQAAQYPSLQESLRNLEPMLQVNWPS